MRRVTREEAAAMVAGETTSWPRGCALCALSTEMVGENRHAVCVLDCFAARRGHLLVVHRRHVESVADMPWEEYAAMQALAWQAANALTSVVRPTRTFVACLGSAKTRTTSFPHAHIHVVPLYLGDERDRPSEVLTWGNGVLVYEENEASELATELRAAWPGDPLA